MIWFMVKLQNLKMNVRLRLPASALYQHAVIKGHQTVQTELMTSKILKSKQGLWSLKVNKTCFFIQPMFKCVPSSTVHKTIKRFQESGQISDQRTRLKVNIGRS